VKRRDEEGEEGVKNPGNCVESYSVACKESIPMILD